MATFDESVALESLMSSLEELLPKCISFDDFVEQLVRHSDKLWLSKTTQQQLIFKLTQVNEGADLDQILSLL